MTDKETPVAAILFFKMRPKIFPVKILQWGTYRANLTSLPIIPFALDGPTKVVAESPKNACGGHLVFQNEAKNIPRQDFMVMNISCKFEKGSYNLFSIKCENISKKEKKIASVRYFGGLWMIFSEELQGQISACLQRTYICIIYTSHRMI